MLSLDAKTLDISRGRLTKTSICKFADGLLDLETIQRLEVVAETYSGDQLQDEFWE
jgi:hypothetical protein